MDVQNSKSSMRPVHGLFLLLLAGIFACSPRQQEQRLLAIVEKGISAIGFYSPEGERLAHINLDTIPHEMRFSPDRKYAFITNTGTLRYADSVDGGETISVINLQNLQKEEDILLEPYRRPHGVDIDPVTGYLAVGMENPDRVLLIDPVEGKILKDFDNRGKTPHMVTLSRGAEWIYVSNIASANLVGINTATGEHFTVEVGYKPQEIVLSPDESILYVGCDEYIAVIDAGKQKEIARISNGSNRMDLIRDGELLVFASTRFGVGFADAGKYTMIHHIDLPYKPYSLHVSENGQWAYVSAEEQDIVYTIGIEEMAIVDSFQTGPGFRPDPVQDFLVDKKVLENTR